MSHTSATVQSGRRATEEAAETLATEWWCDVTEIYKTQYISIYKIFENICFYINTNVQSSSLFDREFWVASCVLIKAPCDLWEKNHPPDLNKLYKSDNS